MAHAQAFTHTHAYILIVAQGLRQDLKKLSKQMQKHQSSSTSRSLLTSKAESEKTHELGPSGEPMVDKLLGLKKLFDAGIISQEEFDQDRANFLRIFRSESKDRGLANSGGPR